MLGPLRPPRYSRGPLFIFHVELVLGLSNGPYE